MPNQEIKNFIDKLGAGKNAEAGDAFKDALRSKVGDALDQRRKDMASAMFNGQAMPHSDSKPQVATPGQFNQDGTITNSDIADSTIQAGKLASGTVQNQSSFKTKFACFFLKT